MHINELRNTLERNHWLIAEELEGNDYDVSAVWLITRPDGSGKLHLQFEVMKELVTPPFEKSIGCTVKELPRVSLYFARVNRSWSGRLEAFMQDLNEATT